MDTTPLDRLTALLERFPVRAHLFHAGPLCGTTRYAPDGHGFLHVLRRGEMALSHQPRSGLPRRVQVREPTLLLYPRPTPHAFHNAPAEGADFTCAALHFEGGDNHPLARALPDLLRVPLSRVPGMSQALDLLFDEADRPRCGARLLADRLFEVVLIQLLRWVIDHHEEAGVSLGLITGLSEPRLARALVAMHEAPGQPWPLERMAACAGMSRSAFAATFRQVLGMTPADYLTQWRLTLAREALRQGRPVKAIADELGYANASALSRVFTERVGMSPRAWLQSGGNADAAMADGPGSR